MIRRRLPRPFVGALVALLALGVPVAAQDSPPAAADHVSKEPAASPPFSVGEKATYEVRFGPLKVGTGSMEVAGIDTVRGRPAWHSIFSIRGGTFFYKVRDKLESWMELGSLSSLRHVQDLNEGSRDRERHFEIYPRRSAYTEDGGDEKPSVSNPLDDGSFLYFVRTIPLEVGREYTFSRYFRPDRNPVRIRVLRRERVTVPNGTYDAVVIQPIIKTKGIFSEGGHAEVWLSDDANRIILQMKSKLSIGSLNLYLTGYTPGGADAVVSGSGRP